MKAFETPAGKKLEMFICPTTAHIRLKFNPGGELPAELAGLYTSENAVEQDVNKYLDRIKDRKK